MRCCGNEWLTVSVGSATRLSVVPLVKLGARLVAGRFAQRVGLTQAVGRRRLAGIAAVLGDLDSSASSRSYSVNTTPSSSPRVRAEKSGGVRFFAMASMMSRLENVYNCFFEKSLTLNSH